MASLFTKTLYKHTQAKWAHEMVRLGRFRIGTLQGFRKLEGLDPMIGDKHEGDTLRTYRSPHAEHEVIGEALEFGKRVMRLKQADKIRVFGASFVEILSWPNAFVYCLTLNDRIGGAFAPSYDTVVEIRRPRQFADALTDALVRRVPVLGIRESSIQLSINRVRYLEREVKFDADRLSQPFLVKPLRYASQREVRITWHVPLGRMEPVDVVSLEAASFCRIVHTD
jgi:hypothetical protein